MRNNVIYVSVLTLFVFVFTSSVLGFATSCNKETMYSLKSVATETEPTTEETTTEEITTSTTEASFAETAASETETKTASETTTSETLTTTTKAVSETKKSTPTPKETKKKKPTSTPKPAVTKAPTKAPTKKPTTKPVVKPKTTKTPTKKPTPVPSKGYAMVKVQFNVTMRDKDENGNYIKHSFTKNIKCVTTKYHSKKTGDYGACENGAATKAVKAEVGSNFRNYSCYKVKVVEFLN